jgi:HlyD family secretion protein
MAPSRLPRLALVVAVVLAAVAATGWFLYTRNIPLVEVAPVRSGRLAQTVVVSGRVLAPAKVDVGATITGRVQRVAVDDGAKVAANALLIELERSELEAALAQARATERAAQTRIAQWREVAAPNARELVTQAEANLRVAERDLARQEDLVGRKFVAEARVDEARRAVEGARSQVATARATAAANRPEGAERQLLEDQLAQARAARIAAEAKLDQTRILAPANGVVLDRAVEPGDIVQPAKRLMTIALDGATRLTALIDEKNLGVLTIGQRALAAADAFPGQRFDAVLEYLAPGIDAQRGTVEAKFAVAKPPAFLRSDMTVSIDIAVADRERALVVPTGAVRDAASNAPWVLVLRDGHAVRQDVKLGARSATEAEIREGLEPSSVVVIANVPPGTRVRAHEGTRP